MKVRKEYRRGSKGAERDPNPLQRTVLNMIVCNKMHVGTRNRLIFRGRDDSAVHIMYGRLAYISAPRVKT